MDLVIFIKLCDHVIVMVARFQSVAQRCSGCYDNITKLPVITLRAPIYVGVIWTASLVAPGVNKPTNWKLHKVLGRI